MSAIITARFNGAPIDALPLDARGLHYGDGVFRTLLLANGRIDDRDGQLGHLVADAARLGLELPASLSADLDALVASREQGVVKLLLWRATLGRGYAPATRASDSLALLYPAFADEPARYRDGIAACRAPLVLAAQPALAGLKHLNRLEQVLASRGWPDEVDEAILGDAQDHPICGTRSNLFWIEQGTLKTPRVDRCGVAGRMRARVLDAVAALGLRTVIDAHGWGSLLTADEAFVCNSLIGIWPLRALDGRAYGWPGPVTRALMAAIPHPRLRSAIMSE